MAGAKASTHGARRQGSVPDDRVGRGPEQHERQLRWELPAAIALVFLSRYPRSKLVDRLSTQALTAPGDDSAERTCCVVATTPFPPCGSPGSHTGLAGLDKSTSTVPQPCTHPRGATAVVKTSWLQVTCGCCCISQACAATTIQGYHTTRQASYGPKWTGLESWETDTPSCARGSDS